MASGYSPLYRAGEDLLYVPEIIQDPQSQLSPTDPGGYRDLLLQDCCDLIDKRIQDFEGMDRKATDLETWVSPRSISFSLSLSSFPVDTEHQTMSLVAKSKLLQPHPLLPNSSLLPPDPTHPSLPKLLSTPPKLTPPPPLNRTSKKLTPTKTAKNPPSTPSPSSPSSSSLSAPSRQSWA